jgi:hypothetical protein
VLATVVARMEDLINKKIWVGFVAVFITLQVLDGIVNLVILESAYKSVSYLWRPEGDMKLWMVPID